MRLLPIGRTVRLGFDGDIEGVVTGINIMVSGVQYQVAWWNGRSRSSEWLFPNEIFDGGPPSLQIGFR
jgi:hypothetical protein